MRNFILTLLLIACSSSAYAFKRVTVEQFKATITAKAGATDAELAARIGDLQLTQRLSHQQYAAIADKLPGRLSLQALLAVADQAEFLAPPPPDIPARPTPDKDEQDRIFALVADYVKRTLPGLPNFMATQKTLRFQDRLFTSDMNTDNDKPDLPMQAVENSTATVLFRDGREVATHQARTNSVPSEKHAEMNDVGAFGTILATVLDDSAKARIHWTRWEQGADGPLAVFHFEVPRNISHYLLSYCCVPRNPLRPFNPKTIDPDGRFHVLTGYRGELTADPATGTILRLALRADLDPLEPVVRADTFVEYAPTEIGAITYICPIKSVSIMKAQARLRIQYWNQFRGGSGLLITMLNDSVFEDYRRFRGDVQILPSDGSSPGEPPAAGADTAPPAKPE